jgi:hypothetical protein
MSKRTSSDLSLTGGPTNISMLSTAGLISSDGFIDVTWVVAATLVYCSSV